MVKEFLKVFGFVAKYNQKRLYFIFINFVLLLLMLEQKK